MATYTQILYQIVFSTKNREKVLIKENRQGRHISRKIFTNI